ncbi:MAG: hypothetical protein FJY34_11195 [Betaproteobacteria bacterium]|nr:hypothetical protein [Betaproteobacteria bacterium]
MPTASQAIEESADEAAPKPSLGLRLKRLLVAPLLLLRRLRKPAPAADAEEDDAPPARGRGRGRDEDAEEAGAGPAGPPLWRRALPYAVVFALGAAAAGGAVSWLSGQVIARQAEAMSAQDDEIVRLKGVLAGYDRMMLQNKKKLEEEQGRRAEAENRLSIAQTNLARQAAPPAASSASTATGSAGSRDKTGDCTLRPGAAGSTLKGCLEEFNR